MQTGIQASASAVALVLLLACLGLAACGGSSSKSSTATATNAASTGANGAQGRGAGRFAAMRACLQKNGITLTQRAPGARRVPGPGPGPGGPGPRGLEPGSPGPRGLGPGGPGPGGLFFGPAGSGPQLPKGVTRAQFLAALKKCGGGFFRYGRPAGARLGRARARLESPAFRKALTAYAACLRSNGVKVPAPNTSGKGPIFNTTGIDTSSAKFRSAGMKCASVLRAAIPGAPPPGGPPSAPSAPYPGAGG
jgi:hypothetical protein